MSASFRPARSLRKRDQHTVDKLVVRQVARHYQISEASAEVLLYDGDNYETPWDNY